MALQRGVYRPRDAERAVLHQVIAEHLEAFLRAVAEAGDGAGLPQFVEREFRKFLTCGVFEHGVARFRCEGCAREHLVPFSCKGRAWCPSCGGRRMTERAAHLVDAVLPWVPVRQWVLTVPYRLRYQMAWNRGLSRAVLRVYTRVLLDVYTRGARARGVPGGRTGSVTVMQRAGSGLNVNPHFHIEGFWGGSRGEATPEQDWATVTLFHPGNRWTLSTLFTRRDEPCQPITFPFDWAKDGHDSCAPSSAKSRSGYPPGMCPNAQLFVPASQALAMVRGRSRSCPSRVGAAHWVQRRRRSGLTGGAMVSATRPRERAPARGGWLHHWEDSIMKQAVGPSKESAPGDSGRR